MPLSEAILKQVVEMLVAELFLGVLLLVVEGQQKALLEPVRRMLGVAFLGRAVAVTREGHEQQIAPRCARHHGVPGLVNPGFGGRRVVNHRHIGHAALAQNLSDDRPHRCATLRATP